MLLYRLNICDNAVVVNLFRVSWVPKRVNRDIFVQLCLFVSLPTFFFGGSKQERRGRKWETHKKAMFPLCMKRQGEGERPRPL